ncbi:laccase-4-like isoform X1 [Temnothorax curvispinosus]|uniref:Laccase-4-like isoform X1 n=1 Tax=Temnothorax curvispinosus TaxID=300111 RepID=A0A6J1Q330_9HYME|nr:laccase-4-like isoform X1 [Temnothorax curvispinosus]XP_024876062.1 laccase-4-like isoform X1 [Temnothorax curvispinosus]XP_024876063.1 laccase-4-like isoform X1 [Temnothorax curvispinosus]
MYSPKSGHHHVATPTTYILRCLVVVTMIFAAATFLHINNYRPKQTFLSCDRPCHHLDWPMICRVKLTLEVFQTLSKSCGDCLLNQTACLANHCISADGQRRGILTANRQMPGPSIQVCENDILVVDVINRLPGKAAAVHWRGQTQMEMPYMDGAPLVTQCPIPSYTTFQYKFRASTPGTHLWHAHAGADITNGIIGSLIVRQADLREPHRALYDIDDPNHVVLVTQWQHSPEVSFNQGHSKPAILLINGRGRQPSGPATPLSTFTVIPGRRHRFRVANAGGAGACPVTLSVDSHPLFLIALDGHPIESRHVTSITLAKGERADFVLKASKRIGSYWMNVHTTKECGTSAINGAAILNYKGNSENPAAMAEVIDQRDIHEIGSDRLAVTTNPAQKCGDRENLCAMDIQNIRKMPQILTNPKTDVTLYLPINYKMQATELIGNGGTETRVLNVDNATFTFPSSPLLTQGGDVSPGMLCTNSDGNEDDLNEGNETVSRRRCRPVGDVGAGDICECVHVRHVPLGATVEIILLDQGGLNDLVYHLHGYSFYVVGAKQFGRSMSLQEVKKLDERGQLFSRNLDCALSKDTVIVPKFGAVALRFKADNPGYWMLRDEHATDWTRGLDVILQVGEPSDMVTAPQDFPKCGSFVGPDYFLI